MLTLLDSAHRRDPSLDMPWREWLELARLSPGASRPADLERRAAQAAPGRAIGYRRTDTWPIMLPGGWRLEIPGHFSEDMEGPTWIAWDEQRTIRVSSFSGSKAGIRGPLPDSLRDAPPGTTFLERRIDNGTARAYFERQQEDGREFHGLTGQVVVDDGRQIDVGIITIQMDAAEQRDWAARVWNSFEPPRHAQQPPPQ